MELEEI